MQKIGFMQGRLSPVVDGRIQSFPWQFWQNEFSLAEENGFELMEWTLDRDRLRDNPLLTDTGREEILQLCVRHAIRIPSLTGDCFMQEPFWKATAERKITLELDFIAIANSCKALGITYIVVPLVDNGRIENKNQEDQLVRFLQTQTDYFSLNQLRVIFESDFNPMELARFIDRLDPSIFGINYDIGNSAALGFSPHEEFEAYGHRILNVHVKDRELGGTTVELGTGSADFEVVFKLLNEINYQGNFILQTARAIDEDQVSPLIRYRDMTAGWMTQFRPAPPV